MRALGYIAAFLAGCGVMLAAFSLGEIKGPSRLLPDAELVKLDLSYADFVTVMFTGATLVLAGVALVVGLVAIFTFQGIKAEARRTIRTSVDEQLKLLDERIEREVGEEAEDKITKAIESAGRAGALDRALERALLAIGQGGTKLSGELEGDFVDSEGDEER